MAPLCFLLQFRPVKILIKQIFYVIGKPPGILLSLLPAPQQSIMSLNMGQYMRNIYGEDDENNTLIIGSKDDEEEKGEDADDDDLQEDSESDEDDEYEEEDEDYDEDY